MRALKGKVAAEWYTVYYRDRKRRSTKIGSFPTLGLAAARKAFREEFAPAISAGASPTGKHVRKSHRNASAGHGTVRELFDGYIDDLKSRSARSADAAEKILLTSKRTPPVIKSIGGDREAATIGPEDIVGHLASIHSRGKVTMAAITRSYVSAAFSWGMKAEHSYTGKHMGMRWGIKANPVTPIAADPNAKRTSDRFLSPREFRALWKWLDRTKINSKANEAIMLEMALGQRVEETLRISDAVFDRGARMLYWPGKACNGSPASSLTHLRSTFTCTSRSRAA